MKETQKIWRIGKISALLLLAVLLTCAVIVPAAADDSSTVFSQSEIQGMMTAGSVFSDVFDTALYNSLSDDAKANYMATVLESLSGSGTATYSVMNTIPGLPAANVNQQVLAQERAAYQMQTDSILQQYDLSTYSEPLIDRESIYYNGDAKTFSFVYSNGVRAMVKIGTDTCCDGIESNPAMKMTQTGSMIDEVQSLSPAYANAAGNDVLLIHDLFDGPTSDYISLNNHVLPGSTLIFEPTIAQYKTVMDNKKMVLISAHGEIYTISLLPYVTSTGLRVSEKATNTKIAAYDSDLSAQRVGLIYDALDIFHTDGKFVIYPSFFSYYYGDNRGFEGAYVHLGICKGFGQNGNDDYAFAYAFNQGGASTVTGYNGNVNGWYDHAMIKEIANLLVNGYNIQNAISQAKSDHGNTDAEKYSGSGAYILLYGYAGWQL